MPSKKSISKGRKIGNRKKQINKNNKYIRLFEDHLIKRGYQICEFSMLKEILNDKELHRICGDVMSSIIDGDLYDDETIKYFITDLSGKVHAMIIGHLIKNGIEDIQRCSIIRGGGEILLYYILLKYNTIDPKIGFISGGVAGAIPPIVEGVDSPEEEERKKERLKEYHHNRGARVFWDRSCWNFNYDYETVLSNSRELCELKGFTKKMWQALETPLPTSS